MLLLALLREAIYRHQKYVVHKRDQLGNIIVDPLPRIRKVVLGLLFFTLIIVGYTYFWHNTLEKIEPGIAGRVDNNSVTISHFGMTASYALTSGTKKPLPPWQEGYGICNKSWGGLSASDGLSALDLATLSQLSYFKMYGGGNKKGLKFVKQALQSLFLEEVRVVQPQDRKSGKATMYHFEFPERKLSVMAVRGTDPLRLEDLLEDVRLWIEPVAMSLLMTIFPVSSLWPDGTIANFVRASTFFRNLFRSKTNAEDYHLALEKYINTTMQKADKDWRFILTGHSLGGGLAAILASRLRLDALTFSAPGFLYSRRKFEAEARWLTKHYTNIIPLRDPVPSADKQFGMIQNTLCPTAHITGGIVCHTMTRMVCDLMARCGDDKGRYQDCTFNGYAFLDGTALDPLGNIPRKVARFVRKIVGKDMVRQVEKILRPRPEL
jgi:hypothetical protein